MGEWRRVRVCNKCCGCQPLLHTIDKILCEKEREVENGSQTGKQRTRDALDPSKQCAYCLNVELCEVTLVTKVLSKIGLTQSEKEKINIPIAAGI